MICLSVAMRHGRCGKAAESSSDNGMLNCRLASKHGKALTVLCLGAHSDDIEIGCGGTILKLIDDYERIELYWVVFSSGKRRRQEAKASASAFLERAKRKTIIIKNFRDGFFPYSGGE